MGVDFSRSADFLPEAWFKLQFPAEFAELSRKFVPPLCD